MTRSVPLHGLPPGRTLAILALASLAAFAPIRCAYAQSGAPAARTIDARPWPRDYQADGLDFAFYRPQVDSWTGDTLKARLAVSMKTGETRNASGQTIDQRQYGVAWITARTETDKTAREVTLDDIVIDRISFPTAKDREPQYLAAVRKAAPSTALVASLDQIESALAISQAGRSQASVPVRNDPPEILFDFKPGVLVLTDGEPAWRPSGVAGVERAINTRALLLRRQGKLYLGYGGHWATASQLTGPWTPAPTVPAALDQAQKAAVAAHLAPAADQISEGAKALLNTGQFPDVFVRTRPAELIVVDGEPVFEPLAGTSLSYVANTPADVFIDGAGANPWYVLISGRWFTAPSSKGPWAYVPPASLPATFSKVPSDSPKSAVLASIPGTPEARESLVANSIPQTAAVDRRLARFDAHYDGAPQFKPLTGSDLTYAVNSPTPILKVSGGSYYALDKGVWFLAPNPSGPWLVATSVPSAIYAIPAASPLHYVTYVQIYGVSGDQVYVGYTPGYYGTVVSGDVVVYGTGYACNAWVGSAWYGCPATYGYGAAFGWGAAVGWSLAFGWGWDDYWYDPYWGPWAGYWPGYWGGAVAGNVYGRWGSSVVAGTGAAWADPWTGNYGRGFSGGYYNTATGGRGYGYAGRNTNIYTGRSAAAAGGVRYNPETGRVVAGQGGSISNIYTGAGIAGGERTVVNTNTGRITNEAGGASRSAAGATVAGGFDSRGAGGDAAGAGYIHYNRATGDISHGGVVDVNGDIYAGHDGNVYKKGDDGWEKAGGDGRFSQSALGDRSLDNERLARDRGLERDAAAGRVEGRTAQRPSVDRATVGGGAPGGIGGFRGGGFRGGGLRR